MREPTVRVEGGLEDRHGGVRDGDLAVRVRVLGEPGRAQQPPLEERSQHETVGDHAEMPRIRSSREAILPMGFDPGPDAVDAVVEDGPALAFRRDVVEGEGVEVELRVGATAERAEAPLGEILDDREGRAGRD